MDAIGIEQGYCESHTHVSMTMPLLDMPVPDFMYWLGKFELEIRKQDGNWYIQKHFCTNYAAASVTFNNMAFTNVNSLTHSDPSFGKFGQMLASDNTINL